MICNEERHTERLTPKITIYSQKKSGSRYSKAKPAGYRKCPDYKKWTLSYYIRIIIKLGEKQDTTYHLRDN